MEDRVRKESCGRGTRSVSGGEGRGEIGGMCGNAVRGEDGVVLQIQSDF